MTVARRFGAHIQEKLAQGTGVPAPPKPPAPPAPPPPPPPAPSPPPAPTSPSPAQNNKQPTWSNFWTGDYHPSNPTMYDDYRRTMSRYISPWNKDNSGAEGKDRGAVDDALKWGTRGALGTAAVAGTAAAGIAAAPTLGSAATTAANTARTTLPTAYRAYRTATTSPLTHAANYATRGATPFMQGVGTGIANGVGMGMTGATAVGAYNSAADSTADSAMQLARQTGINDQKVLDEIGQRARGQMLPMAYRSIAPSFMGGDNTAVGQQVRQHLGTIAYHNVGPSMLSPSKAMTEMPLGQRMVVGAVGNPVSAVTSAFLTPRPNAQQMFNNVPEAQRKQMGADLLGAATSSTGQYSPLAHSMQHIFEPATQYHQQNLQNAAGQAVNNIRDFAGNFNFGGM